MQYGNINLSTFTGVDIRRKAWGTNLVGHWRLWCGKEPTGVCPFQFHWLLSIILTRCGIGKWSVGSWLLPISGWQKWQLIIKSDITANYVKNVFISQNTPVSQKCAKYVSIAPVSISGLLCPTTEGVPVIGKGMIDILWFVVCLSSFFCEPVYEALYVF